MRRVFIQRYRLLLYDHERAGVPSEPPPTTRNAYHARGRPWGTRETVPRTRDQTINDRVQIDFCVTHKNSPGQDGFGNRVRVPLRSATASVVENPKRERERERER